MDSYLDCFTSVDQCLHYCRHLFWIFARFLELLQALRHCPYLDGCFPVFIYEKTTLINYLQPHFYYFLHDFSTSEAVLHGYKLKDGRLVRRCYSSVECAESQAPAAKT